MFTMCLLFPHFSWATDFTNSNLGDVYTRDFVCVFYDVDEYFCVVVAIRDLYFCIHRFIVSN